MLPRRLRVRAECIPALLCLVLLLNTNFLCATSSRDEISPPRPLLAYQVSDNLRLRGGAFWFSAVAGPAEKAAFWRQVSTAPAQWIRDRLQKLCPFGSKEANIAAKELSSQGSRLRGGGLLLSKPGSEASPAETHMGSKFSEPFAQPGDTVLVTGASGFLAGHVINELIKRGYHVRGTVRTFNDTQKVAALQQLFPKLELYEADLLDDGSFNEAIKGCKFVLHTASPFHYEVQNPETDLVEPAVKGTMNILRGSRVVGGVRRVVITSSAAAILTLNIPSDQNYAWSEDDWNVDTTLEDNAYRYSKTLAEQAAWVWIASALNSHNYGVAGGFSDPKEIKKALDAGGQEYKVDFDIVTMNPSFLTGPSLSNRTDSESTKLIKDLLDGRYSHNGTNGGRCIGCVDVRDVAAAHVNAMENPSAFGRYLISSDKGISHLELANMLKSDKRFKDFPLPRHSMEPITYKPCYNTAKARKDLNLHLRPIADSIRDAAEDLIRKNLIEQGAMAA